MYTIQRVDDSNPSFDSRVDLANKADADLFISVHNNSTTGPGLSKVQGTQVMYDEKKPDKDSKDFAQICLEEVTKSCGSVDKGLVAGMIFLSSERQQYRSHSSKWDL